MPKADLDVPQILTNFTLGTGRKQRINWAHHLYRETQHTNRDDDGEAQITSKERFHVGHS